MDRLRRIAGKHNEGHFRLAGARWLVNIEGSSHDQKPPSRPSAWVSFLNSLNRSTELYSICFLLSVPFSIFSAAELNSLAMPFQSQNAVYVQVHDLPPVQHRGGDHRPNQVPDHSLPATPARLRLFCGCFDGRSEIRLRARLALCCDAAAVWTDGPRAAMGGSTSSFRARPR